MATPDLLVESIPRHFSALKDRLSMITDGQTIRKLAQTELYLQKHKDQPVTINLETLSVPFFEAFERDRYGVGLVVLEYLSSIFQNASPYLFPNETLILKTIEIFRKLRDSQVIETRLKICKVVNAMINSPSGQFYVHSNIFSDILETLLYYYDHSSEHLTALEVIEMTIHETMRAIVSAYNFPMMLPMFGTPESLGLFTAYSLANSAVTIIEHIPSHPSSATIHDVDIVVAIRSFTKVVEDNNCNSKTMQLALNALAGILNSTFRFFEKPFFNEILNSEIRIALIAATFDTNFETAGPTAFLIQSVWDKFADMFMEGLNEILDSGLTIALSSPDVKTVRRACHIFRILSRTPQLFVDAFVNFDCDDRGYFKNIFENSFNLIVKNSYPNEQHPALQKTALTTLSQILLQLWKYVSAPENPSTDIPSRTATPETVVKAKRQKEDIQKCLNLFKKSPFKGLQFFIDHKMVSKEPEEIGRFLYETTQLDATAVGEIIGGSKPECSSYLKNFLKQFDFKGMKFEEAFRAFLSKFVIPGESQMIDRIMEQFGQKYYESNPTVFSCADSAYVLAFSALMLHTDAHHPTIKKHMTLEEFIKNNRGLDNGKDFDPQFLTELYEGIKRKAIFVAPSAMPDSTLLTREQRAELYQHQVSQILTAAKEKTVIESQHVWTRVESPMLVGPMLNTVWGGAIAALSISLEGTDIPSLTSLCLGGLESALHITSHCYLEDALQSTVDAFAKFTRMRFSSDVIKRKNVEATNTLIRCALTDYGFLKGSWSILLDELSAMEAIKEKSEVGECLQRAEELFQATARLDRESLKDFVMAQVEVSGRELSDSPPRLYMLQRIGDVAHWNIGRERIIWTDLWNSVGPHLVMAGLSQKQGVPEAAVDLIRQLASKFLSKEEGTDFHYQSRFLQPLYDIFVEDHPINDLILEITARIVTELHSHLHSGWSVLLKMLGSTGSQKLLGRALNVIENVIVNFPEDVKPYAAELSEALGRLAAADEGTEVAFRALPFFTVVSGIASPLLVWDGLALAAGNRDGDIKLLAAESGLEICLKFGCQKGALSGGDWESVLGEKIPQLIGAAGAPLEEQLVKDVFAQLFAFPGVLGESDVRMFVEGCAKVSESAAAIAREMAGTTKL